MTSLLDLGTKLTQLTATVTQQAQTITNLEQANTNLNNKLNGILNLDNLKNLQTTWNDDMLLLFRQLYGLLTTYDLNDNTTVVYTEEHGYNEMIAYMKERSDVLKQENQNLKNLVINTNVNL